MKTKIRLEVVGMMFLIVILAILAMYQREKEGKYHNDTYGLMYRQNTSQDFIKSNKALLDQGNKNDKFDLNIIRYFVNQEAIKLTKNYVEQLVRLSIVPVYPVNITTYITNSILADKERNTDNENREENN